MSECVCDLVCTSRNDKRVHLNYSHLSALQSSASPTADHYLSGSLLNHNVNQTTGHLGGGHCLSIDVNSSATWSKYRYSELPSRGFCRGFMCEGLMNCLLLFTRYFCSHWSVCVSEFCYCNCWNVSSSAVYIYCGYSAFFLTTRWPFTSASLSHFPRFSLQVSSQSDCIRQRLRSLELLI